MISALLLVIFRSIILGCVCAKRMYESASSASLDRVSQMELLMQAYKRGHCRATLQLEAITNPTEFCNRKFFLVPRTGGCGNLGNGLFPSLVSFGLALVTNRTLLFDNGFKNQSCIDVHKWPIEFPELRALHSKANCSYPISLGFRNEKLTALDHYYKDKNYAVGTVFDYACYVDKIPHRVLTLGSGGQEEVLYRLFRRSIGAALGTYAQGVIDILLSSPVYFQSHFESMGLLFNHLYRFSSKVIAHTHVPLSKVFLHLHNPHTSTTLTPNAIVIGMHVRHYKEEGRLNPSFDEPLDNEMIDKLRHVLNGQFASRECVLLLASDRLHTLRNVTKAATSFGCEVVTNPYPEVDIISEDCEGFCLEQGPLASGVPQLADIYLLGHAHYFMGAAGSTYAETIAYGVAFNKLVNDRTANYTYIDVPNKVFTSQFENMKDVEKWIRGCPSTAAVRSDAARTLSGAV